MNLAKRRQTAEERADQKAVRAHHRWELSRRRDDVRTTRRNIEKALTDAAKSIRAHTHVTEAMIESIKSKLDRLLERHEAEKETLEIARKKAAAVGVER